MYVDLPLKYYKYDPYTSCLNIPYLPALPKDASAGSPIPSMEGSPASLPFLLLWQAPLPPLTPSSHVCPAPSPSPPAGSPSPHLRLFSIILQTHRRTEGSWLYNLEPKRVHF